MDISKISGWSLGLQFALTAVILYDLGEIGRFEGGPRFLNENWSAIV